VGEEEIKSVFLVADNLHGLNPVVADALRRLDPRPVQQLVRECEQRGAQLIDVNPGYLSRSHEDRMTFLVETVQEVSSLDLILDSPNPRVLARGLASCKGRAILSALSLEERKLAEILPLAAEHRAGLVILLMDERSMAPPRTEEKLGLALELREHAVSAGIAADDLIFDPVLPNLSWDDAFLRVAEDVKTVRLLSTGAIFQDQARTMAGLSNLRSGQRRRYPFGLETACMGLLAGAGLEFLLADVLQPGFEEAYRTVSTML
jgi:cobalamin-dependent methionine synthase I